MSKSKFSGDYTKAFLSKDRSKEGSKDTIYFDKTLEIAENEAVNVFSFKENKLLFAKGFEKLLGRELEEIDILQLNSLYDTVFKEFTNEYHDRMLLYLHTNNKNLESLSSTIIVKAQGIDTPFILNVKVYETDENGNKKGGLSDGNDFLHKTVD